MKKVWAILLVVAVAVGGFWLISKGTKAPLLSNEALEAKLTLSDTRTKEVGGKYTAYGLVKNNDKIMHSFKLEAAYYDKERHPIGHASGEVKDLKPGEQRRYDLSGSDTYQKYEIFVVHVVGVIK